MGQHGLRIEQLIGALRGSAKVFGPNVDGFYRVQPAAGHSTTQVRSALSGLIVLPGTADQVDIGSIGSVRDKIAYEQASFQIRTGREPRLGEPTGAERYESIEFYLRPRVDRATGRIDHQAMIDAVEHRARMPRATRAMLDPDADHSAMAPAGWAFVGPYQVQPPDQQFYGKPSVGGRKNGFCQVAAGTFYVATASGGVWKSTDNGVSFSPLSDSWDFLNTTCVEVDPNNPNLVLAGTGDYYGTGVQHSFGIMRSTDGGTNWTNVGAADFGDSVVTRIHVSRTNGNNVVALTAGPSGDIWRSTDGGVTWSRTNAPNADWQDIDFATGDVLWVACGAGPGIYTSIDQGATWSAAPSPAGSGGSLWDVAVSKLSATRWYVVCSNQKVFSTTTSGTVWNDNTAAHDLGNSNPAFDWSSAGNSMFVCTGANGATEIVMVGLQTVTASDDLGVTWHDATRSFETDAFDHIGHHFGATQVAGNNFFIFCGDGGILAANYDTSTHALASGTPLNGSIYDEEFNTVTVHPTSTLNAMGGANGLGTIAQRNALAGTSWTGLQGGDGGGCAFDKTNPLLQYTSSPNGNVWLYTTATDVIPDAIGPGGGLHLSPLVTAGTGGSTPIMGDASGNLRTWNGSTWGTLATGGGGIQSLGVSKFTTQRLYTGATNGDVYRVVLPGTATKIDAAPLPNRAISGLAESPFNAENLIVGLQGTGFSDVVYRCVDVTVGGPVWTNRSGTGLTALPSVSVNDVERDPFTNVYYAATDVGVFVSPDAGGHWYSMNSMGIPNVPVTDLWIYTNGGTNYLYAATYGRGIWRCFLNQRFLTAVQIAKPDIYGGQQNTVTLKMNGAAPVGSFVLISDTSPNVSVTGNFVFPQGATQYTFTTFSVDPPADETDTISATVWGTTTTGSFVLHKIPNFTYTPDAANVYGGDDFNATIDLGAPAAITTVLTFSDSTPAVTSPSSTSIAPAAQTGVVTLNTSTVVSTVNATINAILSSKTKSANVAIQPRPDLSSVSVTPSSVAGGNGGTVTATMNFVGAAGAQTVTVSDTSAAVTTPASITVPGGALSANGAYSTSAVAASINVTVKGTLRGITKTTILNVHP